ncbi:MAG: DUF507 family protein [Bdellovibrionaceae bacterium]|nr:DUF507 family protein [Pseudobdellovibrionaceae bacterium]
MEPVFADSFFIESYVSLGVVSASMRLKPAQVKLICQKLLLTLRSKQLIVLKTGEAEILSKMEEIFVKDLKVEDEINAEAERLLEQVAAQSGGNIDREKMFNLIKRELVKKRNAVI